jgi:Mg-chelatase subunit ChlD
VSPQVGQLDPDAFDSLMEDDPDAALALLADLNGATDEALRALAHQLSAQVVVEVARARSHLRRGVGRLAPLPADRDLGDLDLDASLDAIVDSRRSGTPMRSEEITVRGWRRTRTAVCLLVDRSGSMHGERLAGAAVAAAAVALRAGDDCSVVAFSGDAVVLSSQGVPRPPGDIVVDLCRLRGSGVTDLGLALRVAAGQLGRSTASRRITLLLSDCRVTTGGDPSADAMALDELVVLAPGDDSTEAELFAGALGLRWAPLGGPASAAEAIERVLN